MPIRVRGIDKDLGRFEAELEREARQIITVLDQAIIDGTPVDTGRARANWFMDFGSAPDRITSSFTAPDPSRGNAWTVGAGNVFIHNSVEYIIYLEEGSSKRQAPQGILDPAFATVRGRFG